MCAYAQSQFMFIRTQYASEIAGNSIALLVEIQRKLKYVQLGAARSLRPAARGLRQSMNRPLASVLFALFREALVV